MQAGGDVQIRAGGFEESAGMIVQQHLAALRHTRQRQHCVDGAPRDHARIRERAVGIGADDEGHLAPMGGGDLVLQQRARGRREALDAHVFSSRFFAAGKRTLFRISR